MGRIQSSIGLATGVPIADTVDQLIALSARPRDLLLKRTAAFQQQQVAIADLTAAVIGLQLAADNFGKPDAFSQTKVSSSDAASLSITKSGTPPLGSYQFTPVRTASTQQLLSSGFASRDEALGLSGSFSFRFGGFVDQGAELSELNGGAGVRRGKIRITDRDGNSDVIDLTTARTIDDVVTAINASEDVQVKASLAGDALQLDDQTSGGGSLQVQEVSGGFTASDLGLATINTTASSATGGDILSLYSSQRLSRLNDGRGVRLLDELDDLSISLADGGTLEVDFEDFSKAEQPASGATNPANGVDAGLTFTAVNSGETYDDVTVTFVDDAGVTKGSETVVYDDTDPDNKTLVFKIDAGATDADDIVAALAADPTASGLFTAEAGGTGAGVISITDQAVTSGGAAIAAPSQPSLADLLRILNEIDPDKLEARLSANGDSLELEDKTSGGGTFAVSSGTGGSTAEDLGLAGVAAVGGVITGDRLASGLKTVLLDSLNGGAGLTLGQISITDRSGANTTVDLSSAETLEEVLDLLNSAGSVSIEARINDARNGIELVDTSAGSSNFVIANADATNTADALGVAVNDAVSSVDGGSLRRQVISENSSLELLNAQGEIDQGSFTIQDGDGTTNSINLAVSAPESVGDLLTLINGLGLALTARINDDGDGIALEDTSVSGGQIVVNDVGSGSAAADLGIGGASSLVDGVQILQSSTTYEISVSASDSLDDIVTRISDLDVNVNAGVFNEGVGLNPFRLSLVSGLSGSQGELLFDTSEIGFSFDEIAKAEDALLLVGGNGLSGPGVLAASSDGAFTGVLDGATLRVNGVSSSSVQIQVEASNDSLVSNAKLFVDQYNRLADKLEEYTFFNEVNESTGVLFGSGEALRVESTVNDLLTGSFFGVGSIRSLEAVGIGLSDTGKLKLDESKLEEQLELDAEAVEEFFAHEELGVAAKFHAAIERLAGEDNSLLVNRNDALQSKIDLNNDRIEFLSERLDRQRDSLLLEFFNLENAISRLQNNLAAVQSIQAIPPLVSV